MKATNIIWDADDPEDLEGLPTEIDIPEGMRTPFPTICRI